MTQVIANVGGCKAEVRRVAQMRRWVRAADEVNVYAGKLGYVPVTKKAALRLIRRKGGLMVARNVEELGMVYLEEHPF